jgi:hypothetical protein
MRGEEESWHSEVRSGSVSDSVFRTKKPGEQAARQIAF